MDHSRAESRPQTEAESIIEGVQLLHSLAYDALTIAKNLHIDLATTTHIIQNGELPQTQLSLAWADLPDTSPTYEREGQR